MSNTDLKSRIEAVLFLTGKAVTLKEIAEILKAEEIEIEDSMLELIMDYSSRNGALEIDDENGYILQVRDEYMDIVEKLCPVDISNAVLKTLTVIALKEPIRQSELKEFRGASAYEHVQELVDKGLVSRKKDKNGRSYNLKTTPKFEEYFKIKGNSELLSRLEMNKLSEILELNK
jgi:segregation and condensation protein B